MQTIQPHNATKARAGSNVRNGANTKMQLTLTKDVSRHYLVLTR